MILDGGEECSTSSNSFQKKKKNKKSQNKRRFSDEQIRSLETKFESESTLEPRKTLQLAGELGLQPRQVAIWFQNKRARWKSKQLEQDYGVLRADYKTLASKFETMKKEKQSLIIQLQKLNDLMQKSPEEKQCGSQAAAENSNGEQLDSGDDVESEFAVKPSSEYGIGVLPDDDSSIKPEYFGLDEEPQLPNMAEPTDSSLTTPENWSRLDSDDLLHRSGSSSSNNQWWDFWA